MANPHILWFNTIRVFHAACPRMGQQRVLLMWPHGDSGWWKHVLDICTVAGKKVSSLLVLKSSSQKDTCPLGFTGQSNSYDFPNFRGSRDMRSWKSGPALTGNGTHGTHGDGLCSWQESHLSLGHLCSRPVPRTSKFAVHRAGQPEAFHAGLCETPHLKTQSQSLGAIARIVVLETCPVDHLPSWTWILH